jgi:histidine triad (HIT) family protein
MSDFYCENVLNGKVRVKILYETEQVMAFEHTNPYYERHVVVIPKKHIDSLTSEKDFSKDLAYEIIIAIKHVAAIIEKKCGGCRVSSNIGTYQTTKHLHWYIYSGKRLRNEDGSLISNDRE